MQEYKEVISIEILRGLEEIWFHQIYDLRTIASGKSGERTYTQKMMDFAYHGQINSRLYSREYKDLWNDFKHMTSLIKICA